MRCWRLLTGSFRGQLKSKKFIEKIKYSTFNAIAKKRAKLIKDWSVFADVITIFEKDIEVIILDYKEQCFVVY